MKQRISKGLIARRWYELRASYADTRPNADQTIPLTKTKVRMAELILDYYGIHTPFAPLSRLQLTKPKIKRKTDETQTH